MSLYQPITYINNGEPLDQETLNRDTRDIQDNLENLVTRLTALESSIGGSVAEVPNTLALRNANGTSSFSEPTHLTHPIRLGETNVNAIGGSVPIRNANGTFSVSEPTAASHPVRLGDMPDTSVSADPNTLALRNANGTFSVSAPTAPSHPLRLAEANVSAVGGTLALRNANGTFSVSAPTAASHPVRLADIDDLVNVDDFFTGANNSLGVNGFQRLPGVSMIVQWGVVSIPPGGMTVTFPMTFPNACRSVVATQMTTIVKDANLFVTDFTPSSFFVRIPSNPHIISYIAVGY